MFDPNQLRFLLSLSPFSPKFADQLITVKSGLINVATSLNCARPNSNSFFSSFDDHFPFASFTCTKACGCCAFVFRRPYDYRTACSAISRSDITNIMPLHRAGPVLITDLIQIKLFQIKTYLFFSFKQSS